MSMVMPSSSTSSSCCFPSRFPSSLCFLAALAGCCWLLSLSASTGMISCGLMTRLGDLPPCARDPTSQPRISHLRSSQRPFRVSTRSRRIPLLGRRHRSRCHALLAGLALLRFVTSYNIQARRTCFSTGHSAQKRITFPGSFAFLRYGLCGGPELLASRSRRGATSISSVS